MAVKLFDYQWILMKIGIRGFFGSLWTNLISDFQNSKWRIQYGGSKFVLLFLIDSETVIDRILMTSTTLFGLPLGRF